MKTQNKMIQPGSAVEDIKNSGKSWQEIEKERMWKKEKTDFFFVLTHIKQKQY